MSFQASISTNEHQVLWTKVIYCLSTISDTVKLQFNTNHVLVSSINATKTSLFRVSFNSKRFFKNLTLKPDQDFSILVSSKLLALIFKNYRLGVEDVEFFRFTINESVQNKRINRSRNKLFIEIVTKSNLKKNYSLNFVRCKESSDLKIDKKYKELVLNQHETRVNDEERVHYLMMETAVLKNFLDMFPSSIEDFKIEVALRLRRLNLIGFNKQQTLTNAKISKESQALRQPMSLSIGISLNDLLGDNFPEEDDDSAGHSNEKLNIVYRLRDFKNFVSLVNSINFSQILKDDLLLSSTAPTSTSSHFDPPRANIQNFVEILFNRPGFPVLLSKRFELPNPYLSGNQVTNTIDSVDEEYELFKIDLILISDFEGDNIQIPDQDLVIPKIQLLRSGSDVEISLERASTEEPLFVREDNDETDVPVAKTARSSTTTNHSRRKFHLQQLLKRPDPVRSKESNSQDHRTSSSENPQSVLWNESPRANEVDAAYLRNLTEEYRRENHENDEYSGKRRRTGLERAIEHNQEDPDLEEELLGLTQGIYKVKGLFD